MKSFANKQSIFIIYLFFIFLGLIAFIFNRFLVLTPLTISLTFLLSIFWPGFALKRLIRIKFSDYLTGLILTLALGLIFNLLFCLLAILFGLTISMLVNFLLIAYLLIFIFAFIFDFLKPELSEPPIVSSWQFKDLLKWENLTYVFLAIVIILVLATVDQLGTNFTGDPLDHLAIMRKAIEGQPMTMENLSHAKNNLQIAYVFPVWHVFLTFLTKVIQTNIFVLYREITTVLVFLVFLVWYWLLRKILPTRSLAILALFLFILFHFGNNAYLYTRLPVPDTINMLLLMPLCFGLALKYIFDKDSSYKYLIILSLMLSLMGLIHWTQYFYWLLAMGLFAIFYLIFRFRDKNFAATFQKIILSIFANMVLVIPLLIYLQAKSGAVSSNIETFSAVTKGSTNDRLNKFDPYFKLSYILLPLIICFLRQYRRLIFILGVFLVGPIVYNIPWLYNLLRQFLSHVFVNRLYSNLGQWPYLIWAILLGFILVLIDRCLVKIYENQKYLRYLIDSLLGLFLIWMFYGEYKTGMIEKWSKAVFSTSLFNFLNANYYWLILVIIIISVSIYIGQKYYPKLLEFFQFQEYKNYPTMLFLTLIIVFFLGVASYSHLSYYPKKELHSWNFFRQAYDPTLDIVNPDKFGGLAAIDFIKANIPPKSVFDTNTFANYTLPTVADVYMASYSIDPVAPTKKYADLYESNISIERKRVMLKEGDIDYLIYQYQTSDKSTSFDAYPQYFIKIYDSNSAAIYQVNKIAF